MDSCLLRLFGEESDPMAEDEVGEDVVRERKDFVNHITGTKDDYGREVLVKQIMTLRLARKNMYKVTGTTNYGDRYQESNSDAQVRAIAKDLVNSKVFTYDVEKDGPRTTCGPKDDTPLYMPRDCWGEGVRNIITGVPLRKYKAGGRYDWEEVNTLEEVLEADS